MEYNNIYAYSTFPLVVVELCRKRKLEHISLFYSYNEKSDLTMQGTRKQKQETKANQPAEFC